MKAKSSIACANSLSALMTGTVVRERAPREVSVSAMAQRSASITHDLARLSLGHIRFSPCGAFEFFEVNGWVFAARAESPLGPSAHRTPNQMVGWSRDTDRSISMFLTKAANGEPLDV